MNNGSSFSPHFTAKVFPPPPDKFYYESSNQDSVFASTACGPNCSNGPHLVRTAKHKGPQLRSWSS